MEGAATNNVTTQLMTFAARCSGDRTAGLSFRTPEFEARSAALLPKTPTARALGARAAGSDRLNRAGYSDATDKSPDGLGRPSYVCQRAMINVVFRSVS